jgi:phage terminase Nu1 subunit (DNA packaging protein)
MNPLLPTSQSVSSDPTQLATKREVARFLQVTPRTIETYQRLGLPHYRLGPRRNRYDLAAVKKWLEARN